MVVVVVIMMMTTMATMMRMILVTSILLHKKTSSAYVCQCIMFSPQLLHLEGMPRRALVDLVFTMGFYHQISMTLNAFNVPLPQGVTPPFKEPKV